MDAVKVGDHWSRRSSVAVRGRVWENGTFLSGDGLAERFESVLHSDEDFCTQLSHMVADMSGFFSAIVDPPGSESQYLITDMARSIPLYFSPSGPQVSDQARIITANLDCSPDYRSEAELLLTRYITDGRTLWDGIYTTTPGTVIQVGDGDFSRVHYRTYTPYDGIATAPDPVQSLSAATSRLRTGLQTALDRLETVAKGRPIVVPLSGGYDSRLLAAALVDAEFETWSVAFGRSGHTDVEVSREVAHRLGIPWVFIPYTRSMWWDWYHSPAARMYREVAFGSALPFLAEVLAIQYFVNNSILPNDAVYCPGHAITTPSGRLPTFHDEPVSDTASERINPSVDGLVDWIITRHYTLWDADFDHIRSTLGPRIERRLQVPADESIDTYANAAMAYERWELQGRMAMFTNNDLRAYDHLGLDWWLPFWDDAYIAAWEAIPTRLRRNRQAHIALAKEYYQDVADVPADRVGLTDRTLTPFDRHLALIRYTPERQWSERNGAWDPPFLVPRERYSCSSAHPLAWFGILHPKLRTDRSPDTSLYALRVLEATGRCAFDDPSVPIEPPDIDALLARATRNS